MSNMHVIVRLCFRYGNGNNDCIDCSFRLTSKECELFIHKPSVESDTAESQSQSYSHHFHLHQHHREPYIYSQDIQRIVQQRYGNKLTPIGYFVDNFYGWYLFGQDQQQFTEEICSLDDTLPLNENGDLVWQIKVWVDWNHHSHLPDRCTNANANVNVNANTSIKAV